MKYGDLSALQVKEDHLLWETPSRRKYGLRGFIDLENIKADVDAARNMGIDFDVFGFSRICSAFMASRFKWKNFSVLDTTIVGCWEYYFGRNYHVDNANMNDLKNDYKFTYVNVHSRERKCCMCPTIYQSASRERPTVKYERASDIADSILEDKIYYASRFFGRPLNILLVTGDADFVEILEGLKEAAGFEVYLVKPKVCSYSLRSAVKPNQQFNFSELLEFAKGFKLPEVVRSIKP